MIFITQTYCRFVKQLFTKKKEKPCEKLQEVQDEILIP